LKKAKTNDEYQYPPLIDYKASRFDKAGVTVLFGGDHGDQNCPISCKLNMSPPEQRKELKKLGYQCPFITFASVQCSTDSYSLMNNTVMPRIKEQLKELKGSSIIVVYHTKNMTRSSIVHCTNNNQENFNRLCPT
jgi:hypothetical protein